MAYKQITTSNSGRPYVNNARLIYPYVSSDMLRYERGTSVLKMNENSNKNTINKIKGE